MFPRWFLALVVLATAAAQSSIPLTSIRSINGTDRADDAGAAEELLLRLSSDLTYPDEIGEQVWNNTNPRLISNTLMKETEIIDNSRGLLDMVWQWGQFLDHDIDLTEPAAAFGNMTIVIPDDPTDPFIENNCLEIFMDRSEFEHGAMIGSGHLREQVGNARSGTNIGIVAASASCSYVRTCSPV